MLIFSTGASRGLRAKWRFGATAASAAHVQSADPARAGRFGWIA
jgi:hypothetical protein